MTIGFNLMLFRYIIQLSSFITKLMSYDSSTRLFRITCKRQDGTETCKMNRYQF
jgi:hypothetical protein